MFKSTSCELVSWWTCFAFLSPLSGWRWREGGEGICYLLSVICYPMLIWPHADVMMWWCDDVTTYLYQNSHVSCLLLQNSNAAIGQCVCVRECVMVWLCDCTSVWVYVSSLTKSIFSTVTDEHDAVITGITAICYPYLYPYLYLYLYLTTCWCDHSFNLFLAYMLLCYCLWRWLLKASAICYPLTTCGCDHISVSKLTYTHAAIGRCVWVCGCVGVWVCVCASLHTHTWILINTHIYPCIPIYTHIYLNMPIYS
jgi:hypothetical protein